MKQSLLRGRARGKKRVSEDALLSDIASAIGEPARTRMLLSLMDGHARTSTELAVIAEVSPSTASAHLNRLSESKLISLSVQGRHRYYSLHGAEVGTVLEGLSLLAGTSIGASVPSTLASLRKARTCYDHMAGSLAVTLHDHFLHEGWLTHDSERTHGEYKLSEDGRKRLKTLEIDVEQIRSLRRRFAYACMDWSERKPHIAGSVGSAILKMAVDKKWVMRDLDSRALEMTRLGERNIWKHLGVQV